MEDTGWEWAVHVTMVEIYNEEVLCRTATLNHYGVHNRPSTALRPPRRGIGLERCVTCCVTTTLHARYRSSRTSAWAVCAPVGLTWLPLVPLRLALEAN